MSSVPQGRFISMDMRTGLWYVISFTSVPRRSWLEALVAETTGCATHTNMLMNKLRGGGGGTVPQVREDRASPASSRLQGCFDLVLVLKFGVEL
ncbi:hypothetical protein ACHAW5_007970 [Stephanodiscus triporus]|uniref:Uncharacterized protein n=1 Tax=Stephanodiscus triporus TaxID=2934178 RepID=A0ABD3N197_9STRA